MNKLSISIFLLLACFNQVAMAQNEIKNYRDFDFWIGEWTVYVTGTDKIAGQSKIESINDGMAIRETYSTGTGAKPTREPA